MKEYILHHSQHPIQKIEEVGKDKYRIYAIGFKRPIEKTKGDLEKMIDDVDEFIENPTGFAIIRDKYKKKMVIAEYYHPKF